MESTQPTVEETTQEIAQETVQDEASTYKTSEEIDSILKDLDLTVKTFKTHVTRIRALKKEVAFMEKNLNKLQSKKSKKKKFFLDENGEVRKNGFARPTDISDELADFLGVERGVQIARTEVTKKINTYVKENDLQDPEKRRCILLDSAAGKKLKSILSDVVDADGNPCDLNFINIQKFIKHHFPKKGATQNVPAPAPEKSTTTTTTTTTTKKVKKPLKKKPTGVTA